MIWEKITEDNFSEIEIGCKVATANPDEQIEDDDLVLAAEERGLRLAEVYTVSGVVSTDRPLIKLERTALSDTDMKDHGVSRAELINFWWWLKSGDN